MQPEKGSKAPPLAGVDAFTLNAPLLSAWNRTFYEALRNVVLAPVIVVFGEVTLVFC